MMLGVLLAASREMSAGALVLQYGSPIKATDVTLEFPSPRIRSSGLRGTAGFEDNGGASYPDEDETNGKTIELARFFMMQDGCEVACDITRGACEHSGKNDVRLAPARSFELPDTDHFKIFGWYSGVKRG